MAIDGLGDAVESRTPRFATDRQQTAVHHCRGPVADPGEYPHNLPLVVDTPSRWALRRRDCWRPETAAIAGSRSGLRNNRGSGSVDLDDQPQTVCRAVPDPSPPTTTDTFVRTEGSDGSLTARGAFSNPDQLQAGDAVVIRVLHDHRQLVGDGRRRDP